MADEEPEWRREKRNVPSSVMAQAAASPGGSVAEIDGSMVRDPNGYVPSEAIVGVYVVGPDGKATGDFLFNPEYGQIRDDFSKLESSDHWLGWLPDTPGRSVRTALEEILAGQVAGTIVDWVKILEEPVFLTGGVRSPADPSKITIRRAALAVIFALSVRPPGRSPGILTGAFSWAAGGLDQSTDRHDRTWLDLGWSREQAEELLSDRIYQVDEP